MAQGICERVDDNIEDYLVTVHFHLLHEMI